MSSEMNHFAEVIIKLKDADLRLRGKLMREKQLDEGYNEEMRMLHIENTTQLNKIIDQIGYPSINKVGKEASEAAWLIIQHSISNPVFMRRCEQLLSVAIQEKNADPKLLAYLSDRIKVFEGKPQLYGTQFDWDSQGELSPQPMDNIEKVNSRRLSLGMNTLKEQIQIMQKRAQLENHSAPKNDEHRRETYNKWRKEVGWLK